MKEIIYNYLNTHYTLDRRDKSAKESPFSNWGIYIGDNHEIFGHELLEELTLIFSIDAFKAKSYVNNWVRLINKRANLKKYWLRKSLFANFPKFTRVFTRPIGLDLVPVSSLTAPDVKLLFNYSSNTATLDVSFQPNMAIESINIDGLNIAESWENQKKHLLKD